MTDKPRRQYTRVDRWAHSDVAGDHHLSSTQAHTLLVLTIISDSRRREWIGTLEDLGRYTRLGRNTVSRVVKSLETEGLLEVVQPFRRGSAGTIVVVVYDQLSLDGTPRKSEERATHAPPMHHPRTADAPISANDQPKRGSSGSQVEKGVGEGHPSHRERPTPNAPALGAFLRCTDHDVAECLDCSPAVPFDPQPITRAADEYPEHYFADLDEEDPVSVDRGHRLGAIVGVHGVDPPLGGPPLKASEHTHDGDWVLARFPGAKVVPCPLSPATSHQPPRRRGSRRSAAA